MFVVFVGYFQSNPKEVHLIAVIFCYLIEHLTLEFSL